jgi:hypothetical protein
MDDGKCRVKDGEFVGGADATMLRYQTGMLLHILK